MPDDPNTNRSAEPQEQTYSTAGWGATGRVLVVEDDADVRELMVLQLAGLGYTLLAAANGPEALALLDAPGAPDIDLVLTDLALPGGMSGVELIRAARARRPGLRAVLTSAHVVHNGSVSGPPGVEELGTTIHVLPKPYRRAELARVMRDAFGGPEATP